MDALPRARCEGVVCVRDGRAVGFAEWGDPDGRPVVVFHGGPGSRLLGLGCEEEAVRLGLRLVCLERPGFGLSDPAPERTLIGWADDVADATRACRRRSAVAAPALGFELRDIAVPIHWWHGSLDPIVPLHDLREATAGVRDFELTVFDGEGHAIGFTHGVEILGSIAPLA